MRRTSFLLPAILLAPTLAAADEGFWTFDHFPGQRVKQRYGVEVKADVLERAAHAAAEVSGQSGAFVSGKGLVAIKHGAVKACLHALREARRTSGRFVGYCQDPAIRQAIPLFDRLYCRPLDRAAEYDYLELGYLARTAADELRCPGLSVSRLLEVTDVTDRVRARLTTLPAGLPADERSKATWKVIGEMDTGCRRPDERCRIVSLHGGSRYELHRNKHYTDVRLVFAPERRLADFGDLQDHLNFPDHDFKTAFVRAYEDGRPAETPTFLHWSTRRLKEGELILAVAHPEPVSRGQLASGLERERDEIAASLAHGLELRGLLTEIAAQRPAVAPGFDFDNQNALILFLESRLRGLSYDVIQRRAAQEARLMEALERRRDPHLEEVKDTLDRAARAHQAYLATRDRSLAIESLSRSRMLMLAATAMKLAQRPEQEWRRGELLLPRNLDEEAEVAALELAFRKQQETFASADPFLRKLLGGQSARQRARALVRGSQLRDPAFRRRLAFGGQAALEAARDPMIELVRSVYSDAEAVYELKDRARTLEDAATDVLAAARYRLGGDEVYPEGTNTVRIAFGAIAGYEEGGKWVAPVTTLQDLFDLSADGGPHRLPDSWLAARAALDLSAPLNVASNTDMVAPAAILDASGDLVAIAFNGNRHYGSVEAGEGGKTRIVCVHNAAVVEGLRHVYQATRLLEELGVSAGGGPRAGP